MEEAQKGYDSLLKAYKDTLNSKWRSKDELNKHFQWVLDRAQMYADKCGVTRDDVLKTWEELRTSWYYGYYSEFHQPDLSNKNVISMQEWLTNGEERFGKDWMQWKFKCPSCGHIQTPQEFLNFGLEPHMAYKACASRYGFGEKKECMWLSDGQLRIGGIYVIDEKFYPQLIFDFADEKISPEK